LHQVTSKERNFGKYATAEDAEKIAKYAKELYPKAVINIKKEKRR